MQDIASVFSNIIQVVYLVNNSIHEHAVNCIEKIIEEIESIHQQYSMLKALNNIDDEIQTEALNSFIDQFQNFKCIKEEHHLT